MTECGEGGRLSEMERDAGTQEWKDGWMVGWREAPERSREEREREPDAHMQKCGGGLTQTCRQPRWQGQAGTAAGASVVMGAR